VLARSQPAQSAPRTLAWRYEYRPFVLPGRSRRPASLGRDLLPPMAGIPASLVAAKPIRHVKSNQRQDGLGSNGLAGSVLHWPPLREPFQLQPSALCQWPSLPVPIPFLFLFLFRQPSPCQLITCRHENSIAGQRRPTDHCPSPFTHRSELREVL
jgi:hypothetical protein